jgi:putative Holliday junction resolvase
MIVDNIYEIPKNQRILGLDLGSKTIGVAISDKLQTIATPAEIIRRKKFLGDAEKLFHIIDRENIGAVIIGLPVNMDSSEGKKCQSIRQFARNMLKIRELVIFFQDERMSSQAVARTMSAAAMSHTRQKELVDKLAAAYILQSALERLNHA